MGWLQLKRKATVLPLHTVATTEENCHPAHIECVVISTAQTLQYPLLPEDVPDTELPYIPATTVLDRTLRNGRLWIVVDDIIYDCTDFVFEHPGGSTVIKSFEGKDCTWQFWRFHTREHMRDYGRALRVGRTKGVKNPYKEPPRYVGLRKMGFADDDW
ncbi:hypothetical protein AUEXF2481DRAFT_7137 [Aureobasidium subglaciale EXF-2481]|uniref:Cytochrome b5 heme-binding domain-containing protein n=1 Tax=Aureobasidium subglaciale (strain EXF-2481) TaxID=1043005 RepID=A0A074Z2B2_AURSE|nr:uncharacterized protein AUEXF2481DRAFT_7137 [Aureobasidium subglaciale EXF-2481]KEQ93191.1 hypothetical protein AUEXF2481DRAFT_7137 [Aureobasidium subglaciale EXF-2481]